MVNRANGTRANGHRANGIGADVVAPNKTREILDFLFKSPLCFNIID